MRDKKFAIAMGIIIILVLVLLYVLLIGPKLQGYVVTKQVEGYNVAVQQITQQATQQGYVVLGTQEEPVVLVRNSELEQQLKDSFQQQAG